MSKPWSRALELFWWLGVPLLSLLVTGLPFWFLNAESGVIPYWWRVPILAPGVFDTYVYIHWLGAALEHVPYGGHVGWIGGVLSLVWPYVKNWLSIPEVWLLSRWIGLVATLWLGAWAAQDVYKISRYKARIAAVALVMALPLTLGLRPGVYAWYLPFAFLAWALVFRVERLLEQGKITKAVFWSSVSLVLSWIYPWFLLVTGIWLGVHWGRWVYKKKPAYFFAALWAMCVGIMGLAWPLAKWFLHPEQAGLIGMYERNGVVFARAPFFSNTLIAIVAWVLLLALMSTIYGVNKEDRQQFGRMATPWIVMLVLWFHPTFTGIFLYPDHFIGPIAILSWISLVGVFAAVESKSTSKCLEIQSVPVTMQTRVFTWILAIGSSSLVLYIIQQPLRWWIWKFDPYVVHITHWSALAVASWLLVWQIERPTHPFVWRRWLLGMVVWSSFCGVWGTASMIVRSRHQLAPLVPRTPVISWIRSHVPLRSPICTDPASAPFYAAHTGYQVFPAEALLSYPLPSEEILDHLEVFAGAYDVRRANMLTTYEFLTNLYRVIVCEEGGKYAHNATLGKILRRIGLKDLKLNNFLGCRREIIDANWARIMSAIDRHELKSPAFQKLCPYVIIPGDQTPYWNLPVNSSKAWETGDIQIWKTF